MNIYNNNIMEDRLNDFSYLDTQFDLEHLAHRLPEPDSMASSLKSDEFGQLIAVSTGDFELRTDRSMSYSGASTQSISPQVQPLHMITQYPESTIPPPMFNHSLETISPTISVPTSNEDPGEEDYRAEVCHSHSPKAHT
jgi:hypothetical protein